MPIVVEDGSRPAGANAYASVADADTFLALMGNDAWEDLETAEKEAALVNGAMVVNDGATYVYDGARQTAEQAMVWPRSGASYQRGGPEIAESTIPAEIKRANIVAAGGIATGAIKVTGTPGAGSAVKTEKVDVLSVTYFSPKEMAAEGSASGNGPYSGLGWAEVTAIVAPLLDGAWYEDRMAAGVSAAEAARRGPSFTPPSYNGIFDIGQNDANPNFSNRAWSE